jgi:hypothetical protein
MPSKGDAKPCLMHMLEHIVATAYVMNGKAFAFKNS